MTSLAWHFLADSGLMRDGQPAPADGEWLTHEGDVVICESGLHASERLIDALRYAPGALLCRVECEDVVDTQGDKLVCRRRKILWRLDATRVLHEFACDVTEKTLRDAKVVDPRCWKAIEVKRKWLRGEASDEALIAAETAAGAAAWAAAWTAARTAAWDAQNDLLTRMVEEARDA